MCVEISIQIKNITKNCPNSHDNTLVFEETQSMGIRAGGSRGRKDCTPVRGFSTLLSHLLLFLVLSWPLCLLYRFLDARCMVDELSYPFR